MKKTIIPILSLLATLACGSVLADGTEGDIWQILPCDRYGQTVDRSTVSSSETVPAGSNIYFKVRLVSKGDNWERYHLATTNIYINPPRICVYVSGVAKFADYVGEIEPKDGTHYTDVVFCYTPKAGDFAMPLLLGTASGPASDKYLNQPEYFFDPLTSWKWKWTSDKTDGSETATANWFFFNGDPATRDETGRTTGMDTSLAECHYYIKTVDFDDEWEDKDSGIWRTVHEGSTTIKVGGEPSIGAESTVEETQTFYVWSDNEAAVKVTGPNASERTVKTGVKRNVAVVQVQGYPAYTDFEITGVKEGGTANLVLSAYPQYNISDASGEEIIDYVTVPVRCAEKLPPTIKITPDSTKVIASSNYTYYVTELNVRFTQAYTEDVTFTLTPSLEVDSSANWKDYIAIYDEKKLDIAVAAATNITYTIPKGETQPYENGVRKHIYLFALRGDTKTQNTHHLQFTAATENMQAHTDITGWDTPTGLMNITPANPVITEPVEGDDTLTAVAGTDRTLRIKVADTYADQNVVSNGYQIFIIKNKDTETSYVAIGGDDARYVPGQGGYLYLTNAAGTASDILPTVQYSVTDPALNKSMVKVQSPISGLQSDERNFSVTVSAPAGYTVNVIDDAGVVIAVPTFVEGDSGTIQVQLDRANDTGAPLYAFLKPANEDAAAAITCTYLAKDDNYGLEIQPYSTGASDAFVMADGRGASDSSFKYTVELRTAALYQEGELVTSYQCKNTLVIKCTNVIPTVEKVYLGMDETILEDGKYVFQDLVIAKGISQTFTAGVIEPGTVDLAATGTQAFKTRWRFSTTGSGNKAPDNADDPTNGVIYGDPETHKAEFKFTKAGEWKVVVDLMDKDMSKYGSGTVGNTFVFYVTVVDQPAITATAHYQMGSGLSEAVTSFDETDCADSDGNAAINVALSFNKCDVPLVVQLTVTDPGSTNPGQFELQTSTIVKDMGKVGLDHYYQITFAEGETSVVIPVKALDGTKLSKSTGFQLTTKMLTDAECPDTGTPPKSAKDYYVGSSKFVKVVNVNPQVRPQLDIYPQPLSTNNTAVGSLNTITYDFSDVAGDFNEELSSVKVSIEGAASETKIISDPNDTAGSFSFKLTTSGLNTVRLTFKDKDGGTDSYIIYYYVEPSKTLRLIPHGPTAGLSKLYTSGYGAGRVYATGDSSFSEFTDTINCGLSKVWRVYGYGYKVGDIDGEVFHYPYTTIDGVKTGYNDSHNNPIDENGDDYTEGAIRYIYKNTESANHDVNGKPADSFLYAWVQKNTETTVSSSTSSSITLKSDTTWDVLAYKPEAPLTKDAGTEISLPTEQLDDGTYLDTTVEAVFSLEYLWSDNMGDINSDGIPDAWFHCDKFSFTTTSTSSSTMPDGRTQSTSETTSVDDTTSVAAYNEDEDFLPELKANGSSYMLKISSSNPFKALQELRGFGDALNDAPNNNSYTSLTGFKPERCYLDPTTNPTSTLSKVEFLAWQEYATANGLDADSPSAWAEWSPENPTDPTVEDTDGDGLPDGYEYLIWYRAYVGFEPNSKTGEHKHLTGRKFDPRNPGEGTIITSKEIADTYNPTVALSADATTLDSDYDGLPDLLEFQLGTNPLDFDSDGDGLPDGWELTVSLTDPLLAMTDGVTRDGKLNNDGDAMAYTSTKGEESVTPLPTFIQKWCTFAVIDDDGDTGGVQWYAVRHADYAGGETANFTISVAETDKSENPLTATHFIADGVDYLTTDELKIINSRLAIAPVNVWTAVSTTNEDVAAAGIEVTTAEWIRLKPAKLATGLAVSDVSSDKVPYAIVSFDSVPKNAAKLVLAAWPYGSTAVSDDESAGELALARYAVPKKGAVIAALPIESRNVAYLHYMVYQEFGFDPRTAWNATTPIASRWSDTSGIGGNVGVATRTKKFTTYDEFLVMTFFLNNGVMDDVVLPPETGTGTTTWPEVWQLYTTNPRGEGETAGNTVTTDESDTDGTDTADTTESSKLTETELSDNGADTDADGVPDGWELYVMAGKKSLDGYFQFAPPRAAWTRPVSDGEKEKDTEFSESFFSPFIDGAATGNTDNKKYVGKKETDSLTEYEEFAGTDSVAYYTNLYTQATIVRPASQAKWLNKFLPTDPWSADTDDDGIDDGAEGSAFVYGEPTDNGAKFLPGAGLNPCTVDTDQDGLPDGWENQYAGSWDSANGIQDAEHGIVNGMDGTVADARTINPSGVNRDYDHDGLENYQEYLTHAMRCWRYDDAFTSWSAIPYDRYYAELEDGSVVFAPDFDALGIGTEADDPKDRLAQFWYETLVNRESPIYNPHLVYGQSSGAQYLTRVDNGWDLNYSDLDLDKNYTPGGCYYYFAHRVGKEKYATAWGSSGRAAWASGDTAPVCYVGCSPIKADTDQDGMDDFYELFHGLNPLLGKSGVGGASVDPKDVVSGIAGEKKMPIYATYPFMMGYGVWWLANPEVAPRGNNSTYDFVAFPWLNGEQEADADGDDVRNYIESLMPKLSTTTWLHTDPTPIWMTDTSYSNSLVRLHYRVPRRMSSIVPTSATLRDGTAIEGQTVVDQNGDTVPGFTYDGVNYYFRDYDGYIPPEGMTPAYFSSFHMDRFQWADGKFQIGTAYEDTRTANYTLLGNYAFSFEENEGYDTDHDGLGDEDEAKGQFASASDPQLIESPLKRQAMYFPGENSVLQTMPKVTESHPLAGSVYPANLTFQQFTVECWARPESADDSILVERAIWSGNSQAGDQDLIRKNFQLAIKGGHWFAKYDTSGTIAGEEVSVLCDSTVELDKWTHIAATYDGKCLTLYVNGVAVKTLVSSMQPEYGLTAMTTIPNGTIDNAWYGSYAAILIGAGLKTFADFPDVAFADQTVGKALDLTAVLPEGTDQAAVWANHYKNFFKGWIDEVRLWDGARTASEVKSAMSTRMKSADIETLRSQFYDEWADGKRRYEKDSSGNDYLVEAELVHHYAFDSIYGAENVNALAVVPRGFAAGAKAPLARPDGYEIAWWSGVLAKYGSMYAGDRNFVPWIGDTVAHLPRFDGTTVDSAYWSEDYKGAEASVNKFARTAEPWSLWHQFTSSSELSGTYASTASRHYLANQANNVTQFATLFEFTGRYAVQSGADLLPLGGAYARYVEDMWDDQGASSNCEITGNDSDSDGLPDWWETYADENYRRGEEPFGTIDWNTLVNYHGNVMKAGDAYMRDLAKGFYADAAGEVVVGPTKYAQTCDENQNGIPDWWENVYRLTEQNGLADSDNDGLPNYLEYMLSEIYDFGGKLFSPITPYSVDPYTPDYFFRLGSLYVGEVFTDHDLVDDLWEDQYKAEYSSRLKYDAFQDQDEDGWSNRSENRYSKQCRPIVADVRTHTTLADGSVEDYPIPAIALTLRYNGNRQTTVKNAGVVVQMTADKSLVKEPDATFVTGGSNAVTRTATLGRWSNRHAIGTLTPGNISASSDALALEYCDDPTVVIYNWKREYNLITFNGTNKIWTTETEYGRGTRDEYEAAVRKYGTSPEISSWGYSWSWYSSESGSIVAGTSGVILSSADNGYTRLEGLTVRIDEDSSQAVLDYRNGKQLGTVNLVTGEYDLDLSIFAGEYVRSSTNLTGDVSLEDQSFRISYTANGASGMPRTLYLGHADYAEEYVKEGKNTIIAFADLNGSSIWDVGEPYGIVRNVDVSWRGTSAEIELLDASPVTPRINLVEDTADRTSESSANLDWVFDGTNNVNIGRIAYTDMIEATATEPKRVRVVRWLVNGTPIYRVGGDMRVVYDKMIEGDVKTILTEADLLSDDALDLDWQYLRNEVVNNSRISGACGTVTNMSYLVVVGDGRAQIDITEANSSNVTVNALGTLVTRHFDASRKLPVAVSPGDDNQVVVSANPTFKWTVDTDDLRSYTAFKVKVEDADGELVYDSGIRPMPPRLRENDGTCYYQWTAPLYVGDMTLCGRVFENKTSYRWSVSAYNSKFRDDKFCPSRTFFMNVQTNGYSTGKADVAVKYFGPDDVWSSWVSVVRVKAFTSPDFTGQPVAAGYVAEPGDEETGLSVTGREVCANCTLIGLPVGTYYLQAFVDMNDNDICDPWETQGYYCTRDGTSADFLNPVAVTIDTQVGACELATIYMEDSDTDMDGLPDAWEYALYGDINTVGVELLTVTPAGEAVVNTNLTGKLTAQGDIAGGLAAHALTTMSNAGTLALALGADITSETTSFNEAISGLVSDELAEDGVTIEKLEMVDGKVVISVTAESKASAAGDSALASALATSARTFTVYCDVYRTATLTKPDWKLVTTQTITAGAADAQSIELAAPVADGGFYKVVVRK